MASERRKTGFTMVELLTGLAIIMLLVGILIPSLNMVRRLGKETKQKAQIGTIELAITAFRSDYGDYPPSSIAGTSYTYTGAQMLAEALLGWDLLGFHPDSAWRSDGLDIDDGQWTYDPDKLRNGGDDTLEERKGPYLQVSKAEAYKLGDLFGWSAGDTGRLEPNSFVICDAFGVKKIATLPGNPRAGTPILYYKANTSSRIMDLSFGTPDYQIYSSYDNSRLLNLGTVKDGTVHPLIDPAFFYSYAPDGLIDPKISARYWPYNPDSYILISAGPDGLYGNTDDITNFGN